MSLRSGFTAWPILAVFGALALTATAGRAEKRLVENKGFLSRPVFGLLAGVGPYKPAAAGASATLLSFAGLRYLRPDHDDATFHSLGAELSLSTGSSSTEDVLIYDAGVLRLYPSTKAFMFDHHFFWGGGIGQANVTRSNQDSLRVPLGYVTAGLQGRVRDWYLEARARYYMAQRRGVFDVSGFAPQIVGVYHFNP